MIKYLCQRVSLYVFYDKDGLPADEMGSGEATIWDVQLQDRSETKRIIMMGAMDNLVKGVSRTGGTDMDLMFGLPENEGLCMPPMFP